MSVSKLKRQFEAFSTYLGRDITGHEHLRKLKESFLELRAQLAATTAKQDEAVARLEPVSSRAAVAEQKLADANAEIHKLQQQLASTTRRLDGMIETSAKAAAEDTEDVAATDSESDFDEAAVKSVLKQLRKSLKYCPKCVQQPTKLIASSDRTLTVLERSSVINGWSHSDLWTLGAVVSVLLLMKGGQVVVQAPELSEKLLASRVDPDSDESISRHLVQWFFKNNVSTDTTTHFAGGMRITLPPDPMLTIPRAP